MRCTETSTTSERTIRWIKKHLETHQQFQEHAKTSVFKPAPSFINRNTWTYTGWTLKTLATLPPLPAPK